MFAYLLCLNLLLCTRLVYLRSDSAFGRLQNLWLWLAQVVLVALCFAFDAAFAWVLLLLTAVAAANFVGERRVRASDWRLLTLALLLGGIDLIHAGVGLTVRPQLLAWLQGFAVASQLLQPMNAIPGVTLMALCFGLLLLANEINLAIRLVFRLVGIDPAQGAAQAQLARSTIDRHEFNTGRVIGVLERWLIYLVVLSTSELAAIGLIIAAKGLARMKQLDDKLFAEYMLIGTFLSLLSAVVVGKWVVSVTSAAP